MPEFRFERECRTPYSECYTVEMNGDEVGRVDIHFGPAVVYATLCVTERLTQEEIKELIAEIDERLVLTMDPMREDLVVTVWVGRKEGVYSEEELEAEEEEEPEGDGYLSEN